jgi:hypothetical protein
MTSFRFAAPMLALLALAACASSPGPAASPIPSSVSVVSEPAPRGTLGLRPLATLEHRGGHCLNGLCVNIQTIDYAGHVTVQDQEGMKPQGTVPPERLDALKQAIESTDYAALKAQPLPSGFICPTAADGTESVITFFSEKGEESFASCEVGIDVSASPFVELVNALATAK